MPRQSITQASNSAASSGFLDLMGESRDNYTIISFESLGDRVEQLAAIYVEKLAEKLRQADSTSSGTLADSIIPLELTIMDGVYTVLIQAATYAAYIDEGVSGWANSRGSRFKFKTKGVHKDSDMVKSIKAYLLREGTISRNTNITVSSREKKRANMPDATTRNAMTVAYMVKRQGIKPTHFWKDATQEVEALAFTMFAEAVKIDIINNISKQ